MISLIMAVYNMELYVERAIKSVISQTYNDYELIIIDSDSTDNTFKICKKYANLDDRISIHKIKNNGIAFARNYSLKLIKGEYFIFVDGDDWIENNMLENVVELIKSQKTDLVICDFWENVENSEILHKQNIVGQDNNIISDILFGKLHGALWNKLIKTEMIRKKQILFFDGINICEDLLFCVEIMKCNPSVSYCNKAFYHYIRRNNSLTKNKQKSQIIQLCKMIEKLESLLPMQYLDEIVYRKLLVKRSLLENDSLTKSWYKRLYPDLKLKIFTSKLTRNNKIILFIANCGFVYFASFLLKLRG